MAKRRCRDGLAPWVLVVGSVVLSAVHGVAGSGSVVAHPPVHAEARQTHAQLHPVLFGPIRRIAFATPQRGWMVFSPPGPRPTTTTPLPLTWTILEVAHTDNGGRTWARVKRVQLQRPGLTAPGTWTFKALGPNSALFAVSQPTPQGTSATTVWTSSDQGRQWQTARFNSPLGPNPGLFDMATAHAGRACILLASGPASGSVLTALYCGSISTGAWHKEVPGVPPTLSLVAVSGIRMTRTRVWLTGQNASAWPDEFYVSQDGGRSFLSASVPLTIATNADTWPVILAPSALPAMPVVAYLPRDYAFVLYHQNPRQGWTPTTPVDISQPDPVYSAVTPEVVFVRGQGKLYATTNGGVTWTVVDDRSAGWNRLQFVSATVGWAVAGTGFTTLLATTDGGRQWRPVALRVYGR